MQAYHVNSPEKLVLRPKQELLLKLLRDNSSLSPAELWELLSVSKQGAMNLLCQLLEPGLVEKVGGGKNRVILA